MVFAHIFIKRRFGFEESDTRYGLIGSLDERRTSVTLYTALHKLGEPGYSKVHMNRDVRREINEKIIRHTLVQPATLLLAESGFIHSTFSAPLL